MSNDPVDGGTVTYRDAMWHDHTQQWTVWFAAGFSPRHFSAEEGEAMGLTAPEPAPLVVTCNGHSIELSYEQGVNDVVRGWADVDPDDFTPGSRTMIALARLLRDARQDPQPASDEAPDDIPPQIHGVEFTRNYDGSVYADGVQLFPPLSPLSPGECLRGLLAGRDGADELLAHAEGMWASGAGLGWEWAGIIGDAAREVHGG